MEKIYSFFVAIMCFITFAFGILYFESVADKFIHSKIAKKYFFVKNPNNPPKYINFLILIIEIGIMLGVSVLLGSFLIKLGKMMGIHFKS